MKYDEELCQVMAENIENAKHYGLEEVLLQTQEEARQQILEELADVTVMVEQLRYFLDFRKDEPGFREIYKHKIRRTTERRQNANRG